MWGRVQILEVLDRPPARLVRVRCLELDDRGRELHGRLLKANRDANKTIGPTGVEMEALTAVSIAALTVYDMCKSVSKGITITEVHLVAKTGGQSGDYRKGQSE